MKTSTVKTFYNTTLKRSETPYEQGRWFKSAQSRAGYVSTGKAMAKYALPHLRDSMYVFELGSGPGTWTKKMLKHAPQAHYSLVDISEEMLEQAREALREHVHISYVVSDILDYHEHEKYDFFFSSRILEYVPEKEGAVKNIVQALKPKSYGYIVTKTPQYGRFFGKSVSSKIHAYQISPEELKALFEKNGCVVHNMVHVTCVFPKIRSGVLDTILTSLCRVLPFSFGKYFSESYAIVFQKQ